MKRSKAGGVVLLFVCLLALVPSSAIASCVGFCMEIQSVEFPNGIEICFCRPSDYYGHCNCTTFFSNGATQCLAYGACSYSY